MNKTQTKKAANQANSKLWGYTGYVLAKEIVSLISLQLMCSYWNELTLYTGVLYTQPSWYSFSSWPHSESFSYLHFLVLAIFYSRDVFGIGLMVSWQCWLGMAKPRNIFIMTQNACNYSISCKYECSLQILHVLYIQCYFHPSTCTWVFYHYIFDGDCDGNNQYEPLSNYYSICDLLSKQLAVFAHSLNFILLLFLFLH